MGCGKSSVGRRLSQLLCCPFIDLDSVIEERTGRSIPEIFASDGEAAFRKLELDTLRNILEEVGRQSAPLAPSHSGAAGPSPYAGVRECQFRTSASPPISTQTVLSLGGGTVMTPECAGLVREKTTCIYLRASVDTLAERLSAEAEGRPLLTSHIKENPVACHVGRPQEDETSSSRIRSRIETLMSMRSSTYEGVATHIIDIGSHSIDTLARSIQSMISK